MANIRHYDSMLAKIAQKQPWVVIYEQKRGKIRILKILIAFFLFSYILSYEGYKIP